jgi:hypothetical protein
MDDRLLPGQAISPLTNETVVIKNGWIRRVECNLLWLPQEYRSGRSAFNGNTIAIGLNSGQVRFIQREYQGRIDLIDQLQGKSESCFPLGLNDASILK